MVARIALERRGELMFGRLWVGVWCSWPLPIVAILSGILIFRQHPRGSAMARKRKFNTEVPATIKLNLLGRKFGRLTVVGFGGYTKPSQRRHRVVLWTCECECGSVRDYRIGNLRSGRSTQCKECGRKRAIANLRKHGQSKTPAYATWNQAKVAGTLCRMWMQFVAFYRDMGDRPVGKYLRRKNTSRLHSPNNSYWGDKQQNPPQRLVAYAGRTMGLSEWARELGIHRQTLSLRLAAGWSVEDALTTPPRPYGGRSARHKRIGGDGE